MEDETNDFINVPETSMQYCRSRTMMSPDQIVEIGDDSIISYCSSSIDVNNKHSISADDVYVAVGKNDSPVLKWALDHHPGARVFLVHVFPPLTFIPTPVGKLSRSQLSQEQVRVYLNEENNKRRNNLQKYIRLCDDAKVTVDTMLIESNSTAKAILGLIPVLNITKLVIGSKCSSSSWRPIKKIAKGEYVKKNAPDYCEITIVRNGQKVTKREYSSLAFAAPRIHPRRNSERKLWEYFMCFLCKST
ncbi:hypothetical protein ACFE04_027768 [Oxalis oulophora]